MVNRLSTERRAQVIGCLVEGNSIRATVRLTGAAKNTVSKLLVDLGIACSDYQDGALRNLTCERVQVDEIWSFVGANLTAAVSLHFMYYNLARPHMTLTKRADGVRTTPAMAAGVTDHVWSLTEIVGLLDSNSGSN